MTKGPFSPIIMWFGYEEASWAVIPWGARIAVMIGDAWQWIPFMFIVLWLGLRVCPRSKKKQQSWMVLEVGKSSGTSHGPRFLSVRFNSFD